MPPSLPPWRLPLRAWQERAFRGFVARADSNFLIVATPGGGKTLTALRILHHLLHTGEAERVVIVCPTSALKKQWRQKAHAAGLELQSDFINGSGLETRDFHGIVLTYSQLASEPAFHRALAQQRRTALVLDEIHHAGDELSWGRALLEAGEPAVARIALSGTAFRSDNQRIPFVQYAETWTDRGPIHQSQADFTYGYAEALDENICRPVMFPHYEGEMSWQEGPVTRTATFDDDLDDRAASRRLRTALNAQHDWLPQVLKDASDKLDTLRQTHANAGGLVIAMDMAHARDIAQLLKKLTGDKPTLVLSDEPTALQQLDTFAGNAARWLVAVRMVSEGVDIPRLRVVVYATNIVTELFFRQAVGRVVRVQADLDANIDQTGYFFIPKDARLLAFAQQIKAERDHQLEVAIQRESASEAESVAAPVSYLPLHAEGAFAGMIYDQQSYARTELQLAERYLQQAHLPSHVQPAHVAQLMRVLQANSAEWIVADPPPAPADAPLEERKLHLRRQIQRLVNQLAYARQCSAEIIYHSLQRRQGVRQEQADEAQLIERRAIVRAWLQEHPHDRQ